jgi:desulfoferrodoxin (superoxide reductase-like protein)
MKASKAGTFQALALCNIHGLWEGEQALKVEMPEAVKVE